MRIKDLRTGDYFRVDLPGNDRVYRFSHLDGLYSYTTDEEGRPEHWAFYTPVTVVEKDDVRSAMVG